MYLETNITYIESAFIFYLVSAKQYNNKSQILFVCALALGEDKFYPSRYNQDTRFLGAFASTNESELKRFTMLGVQKSNHLYKSNVAINPLTALQSGAAWK